MNLRSGSCAPATVLGQGALRDSGSRGRLRTSPGHLWAPHVPARMDPGFLRGHLDTSASPRQELGGSAHEPSRGWGRCRPGSTSDILSAARTQREPGSRGSAKAPRAPSTSRRGAAGLRGQPLLRGIRRTLVVVCDSTLGARAATGGHVRRSAGRRGQRLGWGQLALGVDCLSTALGDLLAFFLFSCPRVSRRK